MVKDILIVLALIAFGCYAIFSTYKNPNKSFWSSDFKGYAGGIILIIGAILYLLKNLHIINW